MLESLLHISPSRLLARIDAARRNMVSYLRPFAVAAAQLVGCDTHTIRSTPENRIGCEECEYKEHAGRFRKETMPRCAEQRARHPNLDMTREQAIESLRSEWDLAVETSVGSQKEREQAERDWRDVCNALGFNDLGSNEYLATRCVRCGLPYLRHGQCSNHEKGCQGGRGENPYATRLKLERQPV